MLDVKDRLTYADYMKTSDDERYELLNGELIMSPSPREIHQYILSILHLQIGAFVRERSLGKVYFSPFDVVLSDTDVVQPDLLFVSNERAAIITAGQCPGRARPGGRNPLPRHSRARQDSQTRPVRPARRARVLDRRPRRQDGYGAAAGRGPLRGQRDLWGGADAEIHRRWRGSASRWGTYLEGLGAGQNCSSTRKLIVQATFKSLKNVYWDAMYFGNPIALMIT